MGASPQVPAAAWLWEVRAGRGARASGGCGAVCSTVFTNASHTGAGSRAPGACWGSRTPGPLSENRGPEVRLPPAEGQWLLLSGVPFPKRRAVSPGRAVRGALRSDSAQTPSRGGPSPQPASCTLAPSRGAETRTPPPSVSRRCRPSHLPVPFSDSSSGSLPPRSREKLRQQLRSGGREDCEDAARILGSLEIPSRWFPETWRYRFACLYVCVLGRQGWGGGAGSAEGCEGAASPGPSTRDLGSAAVGRSNQHFGGTCGKVSKPHQLGSFVNISYKPGAREHFTWQVMTFPETISVASLVLALSLPLHGEGDAYFAGGGQACLIPGAAGLHVLAWAAYYKA